MLAFSRMFECWWCSTLNKPIQVSASNFLDRFIIPMPVGQRSNGIPLSNVEFQGLSKCANKNSKKIIPSVIDKHLKTKQFFSRKIQFQL